MKIIKVLGSGCANCDTTMKRIQQAAADKGVEIELQKIDDIGEIMAHGVMSTPGVVIDGQLVHSGSVPDRATIDDWL